MNTPSPFTTACELLEQIIASNNLPTTVHRLETAADKTNRDPGYCVKPDPITRAQAETALIIALAEIKKPHPCLGAAGDMAHRALRLIAKMRRAEQAGV